MKNEHISLLYIEYTKSILFSITDLLESWRTVTKKNEDISLLYIVYQSALMASSILTPGTIFMLIVGALTAAYPDIPLFGSFIINIIPVAALIVLVFTAKSSTQLLFSAIVSVIYSLLMMVVFVGLIKQIADYGFCSVTAIFFVSIVGIFLLAAILHPQEFTCILHGLLYFVSVPSMSLLLMIYSLGNLHVVSWGTREAPKPAAQGTAGQQAGKGSKSQGMVQRWMSRLTGGQGDGDAFGDGSFISCICCSKTVAVESARSDPTRNFQANEKPDGTTPQVGIPVKEATPPQRSHWLEALPAVRGAELPERETVFWREIIDAYLFPLDKDEKHEKKIAQDLLELRNKTCLAFFLINSLFVVMVFMLQQVSTTTPNLSIHIDCSLSGFVGESFEPISLAFMLVFGILLVIQFLAMLVHRLSTFLHISAAADVKELRGSKVKDSLSGSSSSLDSGVLVDWVKEMQKVKGPEEEGEEGELITSSTTLNIDTGADVEGKTAQREKEKWQRFKSRKTTKKAEAGKTPRKTLDDQFTKVFTRFADESISRDHPTFSIRRGKTGKKSAFGKSRRAFSNDAEDDSVEDPVEAISRVAASNDRLRRTIARKATILKKRKGEATGGGVSVHHKRLGESLSGAGGGVALRRMDQSAESRQRPLSHVIVRTSIAEETEDSAM
ncbi:chitin synthase c [Plakobranchus ocellatus]|uniref:Chitin synthase c n=1 Tax=Plakobranchus ocellatus TaxID=259542 RepID=A0AAV4CLF2_9GAST|nr:chitin synthase c [Plakobranchus ocellatus]